MMMMMMMMMMTMMMMMIIIIMIIIIIIIVLGSVQNKHIMWANVEFVNVKLAVHIVTTGL